MTRYECWMTFSESLAAYLQARDDLKHHGPGKNRADRICAMIEAAEHMDALTQPIYFSDDGIWK